MPFIGRDEVGCFSLENAAEKLDQIAALLILLYGDASDLADPVEVSDAFMFLFRLRDQFRDEADALKLKDQGLKKPVPVEVMY